MLHIVPKVNAVQIRKGLFIIDETTYITAGKLEEELKRYVKALVGVELSKARCIKTIELELEDKAQIPSEGYRLVISEQQIKVSASKESGLFYGIQSLRQLINQYGRSLPCLEIEDAPAFKHRGMMLDVCRHFFDKEVVKRMIDLCAMQKMNVFHLHITDDQGWRIEIKKYPRLTEIGSKRKGTVRRGKCDNVPVEGYFTQSDIREIVEYARKRYIKVIPEVDMPGHMQSALAAYNELGCEGKKIEVGMEYGIIEDIACGGKEFTYQFLKDVLDEVCEVFDTDVVHIGGDEAPKKKWKECPHCQAKIKSLNLKDEEALQSYLMNTMKEHLAVKGIKTIVWNDVLDGENVDRELIIHYWREGMEHDKKNKVIEAIGRGQQVVISDFYHYYMDYPYSMTPLAKTYQFNPILEGIQETQQSLVLGVEAPVWTEYIEDLARLDYMVFPRAVAVAERGWTKSEKMKYKDFIKRLKTYNRLLDQYDVNYAPLHEVDIKGIRNEKSH